jgi:hypothetical protein
MANPDEDALDPANDTAAVRRVRAVLAKPGADKLSSSEVARLNTIPLVIGQCSLQCSVYKGEKLPYKPRMSSDYERYCG